tara:strand:- start:5663 stop:6055 length:393 start_codon:yes stop_codon:yes gene_type:complete
MSDALTDTFENRILTWLLTTNSATRPTQWYVGLYSTGNQPSDSASGTELSGNAYARQSATFSVTGNSGTNTGSITFPTATSSWGTITYAGIFDASTGGNLIAYSQLGASKVIDTNDILQISNNSLTLTLT